MTSLLRRARTRLAATPAALRTRVVRNTTDAGSPGTEPDGDRRSRRGRVRLVGAATAVVVLATGGVAVADAHKTVTLDVDGVTTTVSTFSGSVDGLLAEHDLELGSRDTVSPTGALQDGVDVVVRHAHQVTITADGAEQTVWTTALTADEALTMLATRGDDVRLVASRSAEGGRPDLSLDLTLDGAAAVQIDGATHPVPDGSTTVAEALDALGITLQPLDRVSVQDAGGTVTVVVNRVVVQDVTTTHEVPFNAVEQQDASLYEGTSKVTTAGVVGVRTVVDRVTTVDGQETARETLSDSVTQAPVDQVTNVGTKKKPVVTKPSTPAAPSAGTPAVGGGDAAGLNWAALAACESGGNPSIVSASGKYHGLYQFSVATWNAVGGAGLPSQASAEEQTARAQMLYNRSGAGQWPHCGPRLFG
ncbi:resuscitation-promoting factor [Cellulomonas pakistanensis]|uniref:resuscitation-promoting factor n=1 Tax=Cellulomonas pakistanensis TaxID=992287 RepID=UPI0023B31BE9|nr:resuscitation-promoting factor [Cellulomonas pakistanensis]